MASPVLLARVRELWEDLAGAGAEFRPVCEVVVSPGSALCPPGWTGIVVIGAAAIVTAPDQPTAQHLRHALSGVPVASLTSTAELMSRLRIELIRGPATLAYLDPPDFRPQPGEVLFRAVDPRDAAVTRFLADAGDTDLEESGLAEITSPAFTVWEDGHVVAAAGYRDWPHRTAHLCVLTASAERGRGLARAAASAAVAHAIGEGKLPQWRARPPASRHIARALGFRELGSQASIRTVPG